MIEKIKDLIFDFYEWQSAQPPLLLIFTSPLHIFIVLAVAVWIIIWWVPFRVIAYLIGFWRCNLCYNWFHVWKKGKPYTSPFSNKTYCRHHATL